VSIAFRNPFSGTSEQIKSQIFHLAKRAQTSREIDDEALEAGKRIRNGEFTKSNLKMIFKWKNGTSRFYGSRLEAQFDSNSSGEVEAALRAVDVANTTEAAVNALLKLKGIGVPTASAILTHLCPEHFTVIDVRALNALGISNIELSFYSFYNQYCLDLAKEYGVSVRDLDRALWELGGKRARRRDATSRV
jgi:hypothetical protein